MYFPFSYWSSNNGLIAFYTFNDCSNLGKDSFGRYNLSPQGGSMSCVAGKNGNAIQNNTIESYMSISDPNLVFNVDSDKTFTFWFKVPDATCLNYFVGKEVLTPNHDYSILLNGSLVSFFIRTNIEFSPVVTAESDVIISDNAWYFVCAKHKISNKTFSIQVNNGTVFENTYTGTTLGTAADFRGVQYNTNGCAFNLDSLGIWGRLLSSDELTALYNNGNGTNFPF